MRGWPNMAGLTTHIDIIVQVLPAAGFLDFKKHSRVSKGVISKFVGAETGITGVSFKFQAPFAVQRIPIHCLTFRVSRCDEAVRISCHVVELAPSIPLPDSAYMSKMRSRCGASASTTQNSSSGIRSFDRSRDPVLMPASSTHADDENRKPHSFEQRKMYRCDTRIYLGLLAWAIPSY